MVKIKPLAPLTEAEILAIAKPIRRKAILAGASLDWETVAIALHVQMALINRIQEGLTA